MAYFFILSLFPFFFVLGALAGFLPYTNLWTGVSNAIVQHFPAETRALALQTILNLSHGNKTFLSLGSIGTIWAASSGIVSLMENLSRAYEVKETRGFWRKRLLAIGVLILTSVFFLVSFGLLALGHRAGQFIDSQLSLGPEFQPLWELWRWLFLVVLLQMAVAILDNVLPNRRRPWRWFTPGTVFATVMLLVDTSAVNFYVRHVAHYRETYGAIGAFLVLVVWVYVCCFILLVGAETNAAFEKMQSSAPAK
jgi:membrane protein